MRTSLVSVLAALISIASTIPIGYSAHHGQVAARDPARVRSPPVTPPNDFKPRAASKPSGHPDRRDYAPRAQPSKKPESRDYDPRGEPSKKKLERRDSPHAARDPDRHDYAPRAQPSKKPESRDYDPRALPSKKKLERRDSPHAARDPDMRDYAPRAEPSKKPANERRDQDAHAPRHADSDSGRSTKRSPSQQIQDLFWKKLWEGPRWGFVDDNVDQCPAPLSACPVRGARDADAIECVDLESDLYSCGGCAADDIACVFFFFETPKKIVSRLLFFFLLVFHF